MTIVHLILFYWETFGLGFHVDLTLTLSSIYCKYSCRPRTAPLLLWSDMWFNPFSRLSHAVYPLLISLHLANNVNTLILFPVIRFKGESQSFKLKRLWIFFCSLIKSNIFEIFFILTISNEKQLLAHWFFWSTFPFVKCDCTLLIYIILEFWN